MSSLQLPTEIIDKFMKHADNDKPTLLSGQRVCKSWSWLCIQPLLDDISFKSWDDIHSFITMISTSWTFPNPIRSKCLTLNSLATFDDEATIALKKLMLTIILEESLTIQVTTGGIAGILGGVSRGWNNVGQLTLSGGVHPAAPFFKSLTSIPQLQSLCLQEIRLEMLEGVQQGAPAVGFRFPAVITKLSLVRSSGLWPFFRLHILPGHGLAGVGELCIQERFCFHKEGVLDMVHGFGELNGVPTVKLQPMYEESAVSDFRDLSMCCYTILNMFSLIN
jgi:hypothetical protein